MSRRPAEDCTPRVVIIQVHELDGRKPRSESYQEMESVRRMWVKEQKPDAKIDELAKKQDVRDFVGDHWAYVKRTEHGNEPTLAELADGHGLYIAEITGKIEDDQVEQYIRHEEPIENLTSEEVELLSRLAGLQNKYRNYNTKPGAKKASGWKEEMFRRL